MISFFLYTIQDNRLDKSVADEAAISGVTAEEESFKMADIWFRLSKSFIFVFPNILYRYIQFCKYDDHPDSTPSFSA
jgi:hypothetical protein